MKNLPMELWLHRDFIDPEEKVYWEEDINGVKVKIVKMTKKGKRKIVWFCNNTGVVLPESYIELVDKKRYYELCEKMVRENPDLTHPKVRAYFNINFDLP